MQCDPENPACQMVRRLEAAPPKKGGALKHRPVLLELECHEVLNRRKGRQKGLSER